MLHLSVRQMASIMFNCIFCHTQNAHHKGETNPCNETADVKFSSGGELSLCNPAPQYLAAATSGAQVSVHMSSSDKVRLASV